MGFEQGIQVITDSGLSQIEDLAYLGGIGAALAKDYFDNLLSSIERHKSIVAYPANSAKETLRYYA